MFFQMQFFMIHPVFRPRNITLKGLGANLVMRFRYVIIYGRNCFRTKKKFFNHLLKSTRFREFRCICFRCLRFTLRQKRPSEIDVTLISSQSILQHVWFFYVLHVEEQEILFPITLACSSNILQSSEALVKCYGI